MKTKIEKIVKKLAVGGYLSGSCDTDEAVSKTVSTLIKLFKKKMLEIVGEDRNISINYVHPVAKQRQEDYENGHDQGRAEIRKKVKGV